MKIPSDYWANFVNPENIHNIGTHKTGELQHTPSQESLLKRSISRGFFNTPLASRFVFPFFFFFNFNEMILIEILLQSIIYEKK